MRVFIFEKDYRGEVYLQSPHEMSEAEFSVLTDSKLPEALRMAMADAAEKGRLVYWNDIMNYVVELLIMDGFDIYNAPRKSYSYQNPRYCQYVNLIGKDLVDEWEAHNEKNWQVQQDRCLNNLVRDS